MDRRDLLFAAGMFAVIFVPLISACLLSGKHWKEAQDRARERRLAEARMNARLLKLNI
jgi:hypothetical protein